MMNFSQTSLQYKLINSTNGLSNNKVNIVFQDARGFLWLGTDDGLNRYDGYEYVVFRPNIHDPSSIASAKILAIDEDSDGHIWIGTNKGVSKWNTLSNEFQNISFFLQDFGYSGNEVFDILIHDDSTVWCLMADRIITYNPINETFFESFELLATGNKNIFRNKKLHYDLTHNKLLIGSENGVKFLDVEKNVIAPTELNQADIFEIFQDQMGNIWLGSDLGLSKCLWPESSSLPLDCEQLLSGKIVRSIAQLANNRLLVITKDNSLLFDQYTNEIITSSFLQGEQNQNLSISNSILYDQSHNLWIGTTQGLIHGDLKPIHFSYFNSKSTMFTLVNDVISSIYPSENKLYLGSIAEGLQVIDLNSGTREIYSKNSNHLSYPEKGVNVIYKDLKNRLWVLSQEMNMFNELEETFTPVKDILKIPGLENIKGSRIYDMIEPAEGFLVIGHSLGVYIIDEKSSAFENLGYIQVDSIYVPLVDVASVEYSKAYLWFGTRYGLIKYSLYNESHNFYPVDKGYGLADRILSMKISASGELWVGTPSGLFLYDEDIDNFHAYTVDDGFSNDFIYSIEEDHNANLWVSTNKGIVNLDTKNNEIRNFGVQHGLSCMEFNLNASYYSDKGIMFFGGIEGLNYFNPDSLMDKTAVANTIITGYRKFSYENNVYFPVSPQSISFRDNESVQLFFALLDYGDPEYKLFKYRLIGAKENGAWHNIGTQNSVILSGLDHGKYTFEVQGSNSDGQWSQYPAVAEIIVNAPLYRRKIFFIIMLLPLIFLGYFIFEYRTKTLQKSNRVLREKETVAKEVLKQKELLSSRNKNIEDSLKYAQRIQYAMFTSEAEIKKMFPESFIFQKPKDIVSGDFYWAKKIGSKIFLAAADCTGHGVPGAFMSLIGLEFFRQIIENQGVHKPALILEQINKNFDLIFDNVQELGLRDGMDLAFCVIDTQTNKLEFSGAFNPLYIIRNGEIIEIKGDKIILGPDLGFGRNPFINHEFELQKEDVLYMFSDGMPDQFGGPEDKKFKHRRFRHLLLTAFNQPMSVQKYILEKTLTDWMGAHEQVDDVLVIGFKPYY